MCTARDKPVRGHIRSKRTLFRSLYPLVLSHGLRAKFLYAAASYIHLTGSTAPYGGYISSPLQLQHLYPTLQLVRTDSGDVWLIYGEPDAPYIPTSQPAHATLSHSSYSTLSTVYASAKSRVTRTVTHGHANYHKQLRSFGDLSLSPTFSTAPQYVFFIPIFTFITSAPPLCLV
jgi:hypothetical protein